MSDPDLLRPPPEVGWRDRLAAARELAEATPRWRIGAAAAGTALAVIAGGFVLLRPSTPAVELRMPYAQTTTAGGVAPTSTTRPAELVVHVAGAVVAPGVYRVPSGARVIDAVDAAGGLAPNADGGAINLAAPLADGERVYVPRVGEPVRPALGDSTVGVDAAPGPIDLNIATEAQLETLPGIGPATAAAIVQHRDKNGPYRSVEQLLDVRGIGPAKLDQIRDLVRV